MERLLFLVQLARADHILIREDGKAQHWHWDLCERTVLLTNEPIKLSKLYDMIHAKEIPLSEDNGKVTEPPAKFNWSISGPKLLGDKGIVLYDTGEIVDWTCQHPAVLELKQMMHKQKLCN